MKHRILSVLPAILCLASCGGNSQQFADKIIYGNIITMDEANPTAEAVAVKDGKIIAIGKKDELANLVSKKTAKEEHYNDYVYPGFVDAHSHYAVMANVFCNAALIDREKTGTDGYEMGDYGAYAKEIKKFIDENPDKEIIQAYGIWVARTNKYGDVPPTAKILDDECGSDKPIVAIGAGGHDCWLNTAAIKRFVGNFEGTEEEKTAVDNWIQQVGEDCVEHTKNKDGHLVPNGYFCETARFKITDLLPHSVEDIKETIKSLEEATLQKGYTTVGDCTIAESETNKQVTAFKQLNEAGELKLKYRSYYEIREYDSKETREEQLQYAINLAKETKGNSNFEVVGIKVFLDGVYEALSAYTTTAYTRDAGKRDGYKGIQRWYGDLNNDLKELVYEANKAGLAMEFHAMGDAAVKQALDACEYAAEKLSDEGKTYKDSRNAISHLGYIDPNGVDSNGLTQGLKDIERFEALGVTAVVAPEWANANTSIYPQETKVLGSSKVDNMFLIKSIAETGANVAFHTDGAVMGGVPEMIYDATTRRDAANPDSVIKVRGPEECITGSDSLKFLTTNSAYTLKSEGNLGCIKVGYDADFSIYNKDYRDDSIATSLSDFNEAKLLTLIINGKSFSF